MPKRSRIDYQSILYMRKQKHSGTYIASTESPIPLLWKAGSEDPEEQSQIIRLREFRNSDGADTT